MLAGASLRSPGDARLRHDHGRLLERVGRLEEALEEEQAACRADPDWPAPHMARGALALALGRPTDARDAYQRACELRPNDGRMWSGLARARQLVGEPEAALEAWDAAFEHGAFDADSALGAARLALAWEAWWPRADRWLDRVLAIAPHNGPAYRLQGELALALNRDGDAMTALRRALEIDPDDLDTLQRLALLHHRRGDRAAFVALVEHARAVGGDEAAARLGSPPE